MVKSNAEPGTCGELRMPSLACSNKHLQLYLKTGATGLPVGSLIQMGLKSSFWNVFEVLKQKENSKIGTKYRTSDQNLGMG